MDDTITIAPVNESAVKELQQLSRETFLESFSAHFKPEEMQAYLNEAFSIDRLTRETENPSSQWYVARTGDRSIGYVKVNRADAQTDLHDARGVEVERIYVLKEFQGRKIGSMLLQRAIDIAIVNKVEYVWLGVWEHNHNAIGFYRKHGFSPFGTHEFAVGSAKVTDILMKLPVAGKDIFF